MTLIHSALAGGEWIEDADRLRAGSTGQVLGHRVAAPSTLDTFLRSFTWGSARQLDHVAGQALARAWQAGAGPGPWPLTIDIDSTHCQTYGLAKQGATGVDRHGERGYHPLLASVAGTGDVLHSRLREGTANSGRGAGSFVAEAITRARRADSGFYNHKVVQACRKAGASYSITVKVTKAVRAVIAAIPADAWTPIGYWLDGGADVAETSYRPFGRKGRVTRLIVRRVRPTPGSQLALFCHYDYHPFITDRDGSTLELEADHRRHAEVENTIRDLKYGVGLAHLPSGRFAANAAWLTLNVIAHNLARWTSRLGLAEPLITTKTLRTRYLDLPGRLTRSARRLHLAPAHPLALGAPVPAGAGPAALRAVPNLTVHRDRCSTHHPPGPASACRHPPPPGQPRWRGPPPTFQRPPSTLNPPGAPPRWSDQPKTSHAENGHGGSRLNGGPVLTCAAFPGRR
jgi:hypothetical protein